jgi:hypothetical protein
LPGACFPKRTTLRSSRINAAVSSEKEERTDRPAVLAHGNEVVGQVRHLPGHLVHLLLAVEDVLDRVPPACQQRITVSKLTLPWER